MIIFLYGEDSFRSMEKLAEIKNKFLEKNSPAPAGLFDFAEKDWNTGEIIMNISSGGLFSSKKLVIIKNILAGKKDLESEKFEKFLKIEAKKEKSDLILVFWENGKVKDEGNYVNGRKEGEWYKYNFDGTLFMITTYKQGVETRYDGVKIKPPYEKEEE